LMTFRRPDLPLLLPFLGQAATGIGTAAISR
jgi:hypothetical protein